MKGRRKNKFGSVEKFRAADPKRRGPEKRLGYWPKAVDGGVVVQFVESTREVYARSCGDGSVELLGPVASADLADALLRLPASSIAQLAWLRRRIREAPTDPEEIATTITAQQALWASYERHTDRR